MAIDETIRVLHIEDDVVAATAVEAALAGGRAARYAVRGVTTLAEAMAALSGEPCDVVLVDLGLPDAFGLQALQAVVHHPSHLPCVVSSAVDDPDLAMAAIEMGAEDFVVKGASALPTLERRLLAARTRHQRLAASAEREQSLWSLFDALPDAHLLVDDSDRVVAANQAAVALYRRERDWLIGQRFRVDLAPGSTATLLLPTPGGASLQVVGRIASARWDGRDVRVFALRPAELGGANETAPAIRADIPERRPSR